MDDERKTRRIRHETARRRTLTVAEKVQLTPAYLSIRFTCADFGDFSSASPDDHIKLFVPGAPAGAGKPPMRDYTPRLFDEASGTFVIDFALHEDPGPATAWAIAAQPGDTVEIGGPRGSVVISDAFAAYWLIGDESALPAIQRRLEEWPDKQIHALAAVSGPEEELALQLGANHRVQWVHRPAHEAASSTGLLAALEASFRADSETFVWIAAEAGVTKDLREAVLATGHPLSQIKASGYWTWGQADTTAKFE